MRGRRKNTVAKSESITCIIYIPGHITIYIGYPALASKGRPTCAVAKEGNCRQVIQLTRGITAMVGYPDLRKDRPICAALKWVKSIVLSIGMLQI